MSRPTAELRDRVAAIPDPEVPVLTIEDLGVLRSVEEIDGEVIVTITPTYSGCPAMRAIAEDIAGALSKAGYSRNEIVTRLDPAWSTDWISPEARDKLRSYGIAPPGLCGAGQAAEPACPRCGSGTVKIVSEFGSTACKSLYQCKDCLEPFDHFKPI